MTLREPEAAWNITAIGRNVQIELGGGLQTLVLSPESARLMAADLVRASQSAILEGKQKPGREP